MAQLVYTPSEDLDGRRSPSEERAASSMLSIFTTNDRNLVSSSRCYRVAHSTDMYPVTDDLNEDSSTVRGAGDEEEPVWVTLVPLAPEMSSRNTPEHEW